MDIKWFVTVLSIASSTFYQNSSDATLEKSAVQMELMINDKPLQAGQYYFINKLGDSLKIETLKFYISELIFWKEKQLIYAAPQKHWLIDLEDSQSWTMSTSDFPPLSFDNISFAIGIDSATNVSGALGGDLDPTKGMYWSWQSGYINFKLEGQTPSCPGRHRRFQYHIGGYQKPYYMLRSVNLKVPHSGHLTIQLALDKLIQHLDFKSSYEVMSPNSSAADIANHLPEIFSVK